jgi:hypothetical protein
VESIILEGGGGMRAETRREHGVETERGQRRFYLRVEAE